MKQKLKSADEYDVVNRHWRRVYAYLQRAGATSAIKTRMRRRTRHEAKHQLRKDR